ncbi:hypothetical protein C8J55DRAFT_558781 [Lentinula edodes]|uniref:Uncharacterized protein n=1 Tax=Lentinula lateritia TaxID=40482 RepID=A0A9W9AMY0_9AGAR|nr:hypothetical protein C8J55DRAFT_558781 [Lentinula edodes]
MNHYESIRLPPEFALADSSASKVLPRVPTAHLLQDTPNSLELTTHLIPTFLSPLIPHIPSTSSIVPKNKHDLIPREPLPGRDYRPSELRKHSLTTKRIHTWTSPWAIARQQHLSKSLLQAVIDDAHNAMQKSLAPNTLSSYAAGPLRFNQYCDSMDIPEEERMPAHPMLIAGFVGHNMGKVSGSCIKNWLSGLRAWFEYSGARWPSDSPEIKMARKAAKKEGTAHKCPTRHPITLAHLLALFRALNSSNPFHSAI